MSVPQPENADLRFAGLNSVRNRSPCQPFLQNCEPAHVRPVADRWKMV